MTTKLYLGPEATRVELPMIPATRYRTPSFLPPEPREKRGDERWIESIPWPRGLYEWKKDLWSTKTSLEWKGRGEREFKGRHYWTWERNYYETNDVRPADSGFAGEAGRRIQIADRSIEVRSTIDVRSDENNFIITVTRYVSANGKLLRQREWSEAIPRQFN
jgi:hypothetical protein